MTLPTDLSACFDDNLLWFSSSALPEFSQMNERPASETSGGLWKMLEIHPRKLTWNLKMNP